jgi:protein transport protein SEC31
MPTSSIISNSIRSSTPAAPTIPSKPPTFSQSSGQQGSTGFASAQASGNQSYGPSLTQNNQMNQPRALYTPAPPVAAAQNPQPTSFYSPSENVPPANSAPAFPSYMHTKPATAWNDPPIVAPKVKAPPSSQAAPTEMPTFFQPTLAPTQPANMPTYYQPQQPVQQVQMPTYQPPSVNPQQQPIAHFQQNSFNTFNASAQAQTIDRATPISQAHTVEKPTIVEKGPIPNEHQIIQTVFDTLLNKCLMANNTPVYKRKLEDVGKKLEVLYDKLRSSTVCL